MDADQSLEGFRRWNRVFAWAAAAVLAGILLVAALVLYGVASRAGPDQEAVIARLAVTWFPALFYLWALWTLRSLFAALARSGSPFRPTLANALSRIGWALALGGGATVMVSPIVLAITRRPHAMSTFAAVDIPAATIGVVGLALIALAVTLKRAAALEAEAADLKTVLGDFI